MMRLAIKTGEVGLGDSGISQESYTFRKCRYLKKKNLKTISIVSQIKVGFKFVNTFILIGWFHIPYYTSWNVTGVR